MNDLSALKIGDELSGIITQIQNENSGKKKFFCDVGINNINCTLQYNQAVSFKVELLGIGDKVEGWLIRKNLKRSFIAIGISDFGRIPPKKDTIIKYLDSIRYAKNYLSLLLKNEIHTPLFEALSEVKGLFNRSVKKINGIGYLFIKPFLLTMILKQLKLEINMFGLLQT
jgi:hypothetical protein